MFATRGVLASVDADHRSLKELAAERIRAAILTGELKPGARLVETRLAADLGISRGPVREALIQLERERLVHLTPRRGAIVTTLDPMQAWEIYVLRGHLEGLAVRLAREHMQPADVDYLQQVVDEMRGLGVNDWPTAMRLDLDFHRRVLECSRHGALIQMYESMDSMVGACFMAVRSHLNVRADRMAPKHQKVVNALRARDFERAETLATDHWHETAAKFRRLAGDGG